MRPLVGEIPLQAEVAFVTRLGMRRYDWHEQCAVAYLPTNLPVPRISASQLTLVEPNLDPGAAQRSCNPLSSGGVLRGVAEEYGSGRGRFFRDPRRALFFGHRVAIPGASRESITHSEASGYSIVQYVCAQGLDGRGSRSPPMLAHGGVAGTGPSHRTHCVPPGNPPTVR